LSEKNNERKKHMKTKTNIIYPAVALFALACFTLSPTARAVTPAPDGGYPGENTAEGDDALFSLTTGTDNVAVGFDALWSNTTGSFNTAAGAGALYNNTTGESNTANGFVALNANTEGSGNTACGTGALAQNTTGAGNTALGGGTLNANITGSENTAVGNGALSFNNAGANYNTAIGSGALRANTTGEVNTATGFVALISNTTGSANTANGAGALAGNTEGGNNTATGFQALNGNTTGSENTAIGSGALVSNNVGPGNTAIGSNALASNTGNGLNTAVGANALASSDGGGNTALGFNAGLNLTTGINNIDIGFDVVGVAGESNTIRIGRQGTQRATFIAGIRGSTVGGGTTVVVNAAGKLGVAPSSARFKDDIKPMDNASEAILALKPVTFRYKKEIDAERTPQFGLVAEDVEKVNPDLVVRDAEGKVYTVRYEAVNAMLLNEFLKEHRTVQEQQKEIEALAAMVREQASQIQKVSAELELTRPTPRTALNNQ
jgi:trimeric autotransporter adhesin